MTYVPRFICQFCQVERGPVGHGQDAYFIPCDCPASVEAQRIERQKIAASRTISRQKRDRIR